VPGEDGQSWLSCVSCLGSGSWVPGVAVAEQRGSSLDHRQCLALVNSRCDDDDGFGFYKDATPGMLQCRAGFDLKKSTCRFILVSSCTLVKTCGLGPPHIVLEGNRSNLPLLDCNLLELVFRLRVTKHNKLNNNVFQWFGLFGGLGVL
jgi:hypothetical protein